MKFRGQEWAGGWNGPRRMALFLVLGALAHVLFVALALLIDHFLPSRPALDRPVEAVWVEKAPERAALPPPEPQPPAPAAQQTPPPPPTPKKQPPKPKDVELALIPKPPQPVPPPKPLEEQKPEPEKPKAQL